MFAHVADTMNGITTIRSFGNEEQLKREFDAHQVGFIIIIIKIF